MRALSGAGLMFTTFHALLLAVLLAAPLAVLGTGGFGGAVDRTVRRLAPVTGRRYPVMVGLVFSWLALGVLTRGLAPHHILESLTLIAAAACCAWFGGRTPLAAIASWLVLNYTFGRDDTVTVTLTGLGGASLVAALAGLGGAIAWANRPPDGRSRAPVLLWCAALFFAWTGVSVVAAVVFGRPVGDELIWRTTRNLHVAALFFAAITVRPALIDLRLIVGTLAAALVVRQLFLTGQWFLEQNLAMLAVVTVPIALALSVARPFDRVQLPLSALAIYLAAMILFVQNRGAIVGLAAGSLALWPLARRRLAGLALVVALPAAAGFYAWQAGWLDRFRAIYVDGQFIGSAAERLDIWRGGLEIIRGAWMFGVGPGNFEYAIRTLTDGRFNINAHNSYVELAAEVGLAGLVLYLFVFAAAAASLVRTSRRLPRSWHRTAAAGLLGSFVAHVSAGLFLSNPSLVWTWVLLGITMSLSFSRPPAPGHTGKEPAGQ